MIIKLEYYLGYIYWAILVFAISVSMNRFLKKNIPLYLKLFSPFLLLTLMVEVSGFVLNINHIASLPVYNFFIVVEFAFYFFVLKSIVRNWVIKNIITVTMGVFPVFALIDILYVHGIQLFPTYTIILGSLFTVFLCVFYIYEILALPNYQKLTDKSSFWLCFGLLFFYGTTLPLMIMLNLSWINNWDNTILVFIQIVPNYVLYICFIIAFFRKSNKEKPVDSYPVA